MKKLSSKIAKVARMEVGSKPQNILLTHLYSTALAFVAHFFVNFYGRLDLIANTYI